jgi:hypothetical protein
MDGLQTHGVLGFHAANPCGFLENDADSVNGPRGQCLPRANPHTPRFEQTGHQPRLVPPQTGTRHSIVPLFMSNADATWNASAGGRIRISIVRDIDAAVPRHTKQGHR